jgi:hypothetical protein
MTMTTTITTITTATASAADMRDLLEADFARACGDRAAARFLQVGKDTPVHRAAVAETGARIDAVLDMYLDAGSAR